MRQQRSEGRSKEPPGNQRPRRAAKRLLCGNATVTTARAILGAVCLYGLFWIFVGPRAVVITPNSANLQTWVFKDVSRVEQGSGHVVIECSGPCYVISPSLSHFGLEAAVRPYVVVGFGTESGILGARILVSTSNAPDQFQPRPTIQQPGSLLCDLRDRRQWESVLPLKGTIDRIGILFSGRILLRRIEAGRLLTLHDYFLLLFGSLTTVDPAEPYTINELYGGTLFGHSLAIVALWVFFISLVVITAFSRLHYWRLALSAVILPLYIPHFTLLVRQALISGAHSCLRSNIFEEYASCYDPEFSSLSEALYSKVAPGRRVHFIRQNLEFHRMETNFSEFVHRTRYAPSEFGLADYYVGFRQPGMFDAAMQSLRDPTTGKSVRVEPVYRMSDSFILRAIR